MPSRIRLLDEDESPRSSKILRFYRDLHKYYYDLSNYSLASDCYVSFMVMKRRTTKRRILARFFDWCYEKLSLYGESVLRPVIALFVLWILCTTLLLQMGIKFEANGDFIRRSLFGKEPFFLSLDFVKTLFLNFLLSTLLRVGEARPSAVSLQSVIIVVETLLNALLVSFLFIGVRRHFTPKKPILDRLPQ